MITKTERTGQIYFALVPYQESVIEITSLIHDFNRNRLSKKNMFFVEHITLNPEGANWKIYHFQLNKFSYKSFIFAFIYELGWYPENQTIAKQFQGNIKRFCKKLKHMNLHLSRIELEILKTCSTSVNLSSKRRKELAEVYIYLLIFQYMG